MPDNNKIRRAVHLRLEERGWADRINQVTFRLLRDPAAPGSSGVVPPEPAELNFEADGEAIVDVTTDELRTEGGILRLGGLEWSEWYPFEVAAREATTEPGVYITRTGLEIVYVGMAGLRRGAVVRGRLQIYARGRGESPWVDWSLHQTQGDSGCGFRTWCRRRSKTEQFRR